MSASVGRPQSAPAVAAPAALQSAPAPAVVTCVGGRMVSQQQVGDGVLRYIDNNIISHCPLICRSLTVQQGCLMFLVLLEV